MPKLPDMSPEFVANRAAMTKRDRAAFVKTYKPTPINAAKFKSCTHLETNSGFGLAGGGYGVYMYCVACGEILTKTQTE